MSTAASEPSAGAPAAACPSCHASDAATNVDARLRTATCRFCHATFGLPAADAAATPATPRAEVERPARMHVVESPDGCEISWRWFTGKTVFFTVFAVFWDAFLVFWYWNVVRDPEAPLVAKLFPIGHAAVGVAITWYVVASWFNTTTLRLGYDRLTTSHAPVPVLSKKHDVDAARIEQLSVEEKVTHTKNGTSRTYKVRAHLIGDETFDLVTFDRREEARWLEQEAERFLGLADRRVEGEYAAAA